MADLACVKVTNVDPLNPVIDTAQSIRLGK